jgi:hypothetical protein
VAQYRKDTHNYLDNGTTIFEVNMLADKDGNIINSFGASSNIPISANTVTGYSRVHKFGLVDTSTSANWSTIWTAGETNGQYAYPWDLSANTVTVVSSSGQDASAGSGALTIRVQGLDASYNFAQEDFTMTGATPTSAGSQTFLRVNRAYVLTGNTNVGTIEVKNGSTVVTEIKEDMGQTLQCVYTVPAGKTAYLSEMQACSNKSQSVVTGVFIKEFGGVFRIRQSTALYGSTHTTHFSTPHRIPEKSDIDMRIKASTGQTVAADFELILVDNS